MAITPQPKLIVHDGKSPAASPSSCSIAPDGAVKVGVLFRDETAWLTQRALAALFEAATVSKWKWFSPRVGRDVLRNVALCNRDAIIAVVNWIVSAYLDLTENRVQRDNDAPARAWRRRAHRRATDSGR
jgi:hypothetical protein